MTEFAPVPFGSRCRDCGCRVEWLRLWCGPCDEARSREMLDVRAGDCDHDEFGTPPLPLDDDESGQE